MNSKLFVVCVLALPATAAAQLPIAVPSAQPGMQRGPGGPGMQRGPVVIAPMQQGMQRGPVVVTPPQQGWQRGPMGAPNGFSRPVPFVTVPMAPPPPRREMMPPRPSQDHVWQPGHWAWRGGQQMWMPGMWSAPPAPGYGWQPPVWERQGRGWRYGEGHWITAQPAVPSEVYEPPPPVEMVVPSAPPPPIDEAHPDAPFANAVWITGHWFWNGARYTWLSGRWSGPRPGAVWEAAHWVQGPGGWRLQQGHWRAD